MGHLLQFERPQGSKRILPRMDKPAKVISVTSGKGGVGKTHFTVNIGYQLAKQGKRVLLLDADLGLANINVMLGFNPGATIAQVLDGSASIKDIIISDPSGFDILPATSGIPDVVELNEEQRMTLLAQISGLGEDYDYLLVDTAAGIGESVMYFNTAAEEIVVMIAPEPTSITDAYALIKVLSSQHGVKSFSIIVNRNPTGKDARETYAKLAQATDRFLKVRLKFLGSISEDSSVTEALKAQKPFTKLYPSSKASRDIIKISDKIIQDESKRKAGGGLQFFFGELLENS